MILDLFALFLFMIIISKSVEVRFVGLDLQSIRLKRI